jgi:hypothetical protein
MKTAYHFLTGTTRNDMINIERYEHELFRGKQIFHEYVRHACMEEHIYESLFGDYEVSVGEATDSFDWLVMRMNGGESFSQPLRRHTCGIIPIPGMTG